MMTEFQNQEVSKYLSEKRLPLDLLYEVKDHMISQIYDLQKEENFSFEEAFEKAKISWQEELTMVNENWFTQKKISILHKKIIDKRLKSFYTKSFVAVSVLFLFYFFVYKFYGVHYFSQLFVVVNVALLVFGLMYGIRNRKILNTTKKSYSIKFSIYQRPSNILYMGVLYVFIFLVSNYEKRIENIHNVYDGMWDYKSFLNTSLCFMTYFLFFNGFLLFAKYKEVIEAHRFELK